MKERWQLNRAGLFNFWYYDDEVFHFADGKLLLRGSNGSGKSVTMQSLITVLLDGKKSPDRLDPFGSKSRRMEDYLLGEKEVMDLDERTGYLYLEYKREGVDEYMTTGIGLRAKRHQRLDFWGFVVFDNRRIGEQLSLYRTEPDLEGGLQKIPLTRRELEAILGQGGIVVTGQREYMEQVNKHLFGFASIEAYEELMKLLIQLRSPKLSKDFKPTVIYEILNESLPALADDELRPLSDTIETMDQTKGHLDQLLREEQSLERLCRQYDLYNRRMLGGKAEGYLRARKRESQVRKQSQDTDKQIRQHQEEIMTHTQTVRELQREEQILDAEKLELEQHDVFKAERQKVELEQQLTEWRNQMTAKENTLEQKKTKEIHLQEQLRQEENRQYELDKEIQETLEQLEDGSEQAAFLNHGVAADEFQNRKDEGFTFSLWKKEAADHERTLDRVLQMLRAEERAQERYQEAELEVGDTHKTLDHTRVTERKQLEQLERCRSDWATELHRWHGATELLKLTDQELTDIRKRLMGYPETIRYDEFTSPLRQAVERQRDLWQQELLRLGNLMEQVESEAVEHREALEQWNNQHDPEPPRHEKTEEVRIRLQQEGVSFVPLYAAVEFHPHVSEAAKERLESAISEMGMLDALIVPNHELESARRWSNDKVFRPRPHLMAHTLADYVYPTPVEGSGVTAEQIDAVLNSILVGGEADAVASLEDDGCYRIGLLEGQAPESDRSLYIGKESRKQYRLREIERLSGLLVQLENQLHGLEQEQAKLREQIDRLHAEAETFPDTVSIRQDYDQLDQTRRQLVLLEQELDRRNEKMKEAFDALQKVKSEVREASRSLTLPLKETNYEEARLLMQSYREDLGKLEITWNNHRTSKQQQSHHHDRLDEIQADLDELRGEWSGISDQLQTGEDRLQRIEERLQEMGAEEIRKRIERVMRRLQELPEQREAKVSRLGGLKTGLDQLEKNRSQLVEEGEFAARLVRKWRDVFSADKKLSLTFGAVEEGVENQASVQDDDTLDLEAKKLLNEEAVKKAMQTDVDKIVDRLNQAYYQEQAVLVEYRLTQQTIQQLPEEETAIESSSLDETGELNLESWRIPFTEVEQKSRRIQLMMEYKGKRVSPYAVRIQISKDIALQSQLLNDKDRELYEEIIMNSVGRIIRTRIGRAERWVEEMNRLMDERDTSSGLNFSVRWKPKTAQHEDELDTKDLVDLLRANPRLLKESDMNRITNHFRTKIEKAKQLLEERGFGESFHQMIKDMLDYRQWFTFTLYYRREGQSRKELTNHVFFTFSGGEKAMAMYIPLFSAAYSRYSEARSDAPKIVSLDEAFAGVDENNIRDMFDLVEKLEFNYIMNSQAIWGDYDTVNRLAICELVRPKNAPYVTVIRYMWNGKVRQLVDPSREGMNEDEQSVIVGSGSVF